MKVSLDFRNEGQVRISAVLIEKIAKEVLSVVPNAPLAVNLSVALVSDRKIRVINKLYRQQDKVTDVLSFTGQVRGFKDFESGVDLGEILVAIGQTRRQAKLKHSSFREEFSRLLVHGLLHLLGYNHQSNKALAEMSAYEDKILKRIDG